MRPNRPSWTLPLTKANRPRLFTVCVAYSNLRNVGLYLLVSKYITRACGVNFHAPFTHPPTIPRALNTTVLNRAHTINMEGN
jgi:hypothetical protein